VIDQDENARDLDAIFYQLLRFWCKCFKVFLRWSWPKCVAAYTPVLLVVSCAYGVFIIAQSL